MNDKIKATLVAGLLVLLLAISVMADTQDTTVTYVIPSSISHSLSYGVMNGTCSTSAFFFVEGDATKDGNQTDINPSQDATGVATVCQNVTVPSLTISNTGNDQINVTLYLTSAPLSGITTTVSMNFTNATNVQCGLSPLNACMNITAETTGTLVAWNLASAGTQQLWILADFVNANVGAGIGIAGSGTRTMRTNASAY